MKFLSPFLLFAVPRFCNAWGTVGHEVIANVAWNLLSNEAQNWVEDVLNITDGNSTLSPLGSVADWADRVRHFLPWSAPLHFIDVRDDLFGEGCHVAPHLNPGCRFEYDRDCVNDSCVAGAIVNYTHQLLESSLGWKQRRALRFPGSSHAVRNDSSVKEALMFLTHFVGDIHQPLHCSRATDKGGNDFHVHFNLATPTVSRLWDERHPVANHHHSWNLHSVWDTGLIDVALHRDYNDSQPLLEAALLRELERNESMINYLDCDEALGASVTCATQWGQESWDAAIRYAYTLDDNRTDITDGATLDEGYYETRWPLAKERLLAGSVRLAGTLELIAKANKNTGVANPSIRGTVMAESAPIESRSQLASMIAWLAWK